jgi:hypothetical protein
MEPGTADHAGAAERLRRALEEAAAAFDKRISEARGVRIWSRLLGAELWITPDEQNAELLSIELRVEGKSAPVITADEALVFAGMAEKEARELFASLTRIQQATPGSRLRSFTKGNGGDA